MKLKTLQTADLRGKTVFLRADLDVVIHNNQVVDDMRLNSWFPTLEYLVKNNAKVIIAGHLGRPTKQFTIDNLQFTKNDEFSLRPVVEWIGKKIHAKPIPDQIGEFQGWMLAENVAVLENLRFFKEEENDPSFSKKLSLLADIYVNDAFASSHRAHASIVGITKFIPSFAGLRLQKEVAELSKVLENPARPLTIIIGGAKIETKLPLVEKMHKFADFVLVGGEIAENTKVLLKVQHEKISGQKSALLVADLTENSKDITGKAAENFLQVAKNSETVVWNGPMGLVEEAENANGTKILAEGLSALSNYRIVGGGDTIAYLQKLNLLDKFNFVSVGGGAMLEFLSGEQLPGLAVLIK